MKISTVLDNIDSGNMALPEFQRGYVWNRNQVRGLMYSLYKKHPVGSLLVWITKTKQADTRGVGKLSLGSVKLILDGQQRITTLYGIIRGNPPEFFEGKGKEINFIGLYFNYEKEIFEFYRPIAMKDDPAWVSVTEVMQAGPGKFMQKLIKIDGLVQDQISEYINRINAIWAIKEIDLHIDEVTGEDKSVDVVVDIFNRVNSGGTKLSKGDLTLAKICASWPDARQEMNERLAKWEKQGFSFTLEWLLRVINSIVTGEALFTALQNVDVSTFQEGVKKAEKATNALLNLISGRLGLDHDRVLGSRASFPLMARYFAQRDFKLKDHEERDKLLYWYIHTFLWGRYAGSTESTLAKDLNLIKDGNEALDPLIEELRQNRGDLQLYPNDFRGWSKGARFYPLLYMLTRVHKAKDWDSGISLSDHLLGKLNYLQVHHIFPRKLLYKHNYSKSQVNAIANFTFITQGSNLNISAKRPSKYLEEIERRYPGAVASHWIPMDRNLWKVENYPRFLAARRELLAKAANEFIESLLSGRLPDKIIAPEVTEREVLTVLGAIETDEEEQLLNKCNEWVVGQSLPAGEICYELTDPDTGELLATLDLAWPNGLQERLSQPVVLLIGEGEEIEQIVNRLGYLYFTDVEDFKRYINSEILGLTSTEIEIPIRSFQKNSIRGLAIQAWEAAEKPIWDVEKTLDVCEAIDKQLFEDGLSPAPKFRNAAQERDREYLLQWVHGCRFDWLVFGETVDRVYWENKSNPKSIAIMDEIIGIIKKLDWQPRVTYNKHHIALGTPKRNFCWFHPRKKEGYCHFEIRVGKENLDTAKAILEETGVPFNHKKEDLIALSIHMKPFSEYKEKLSELIRGAWEVYS